MQQSISVIELKGVSAQIYRGWSEQELVGGAYVSSINKGSFDLVVQLDQGRAYIFLSFDGSVLGIGNFKCETMEAARDKAEAIWKKFYSKIKP